MEYTPDGSLTRAPVHYSSGSSILHAPGVSLLVVKSVQPNPNSLWGSHDDLPDEEVSLDMETREKKWKDGLKAAHNKILSFYKSEKLHDSDFDMQTELAMMQEEMSKKKVTFEEKNQHAVAAAAAEAHHDATMGKFRDAVKRVSVHTTRAKLRTLGDFVRGHGLRKIMMGWNMIEPRFAKSNYSRTVMMKDANGLSYPMKVQVLPISGLIGILCTPKVKVYASELDEILTNIGCTPEDILLGKKVAAVRTLMGPKQGDGMNPYEVNDLMKILHDYLKAPEKMISLDELTDQVFPRDPEQREAMMKTIEKEREQMVVAMLEQKRQKEEKVKLLEGRRLRGIESFEETLREIQFVRSPFTFRRSYMLEDLHKYCMRIIRLREDNDGIAELPMEHIMLIGPDYFPPSYHSRIREYIEQQKAENASESTKDSKASKPLSSVADEELSDDDFEENDQGGYHLTVDEKEKMKDKKYCKVNLVGPPTYVDMLRKIVSYGRGFDGLSYRDVIELLQAYCAIRIQCMYRGAHLRLRYFEARRRWRRKFAIIKGQHFRGWATLCRHLRLLKQHCWRKLKAWNWYYRCAYNKRELFRQCFWPFFVWRRETIKQGTLNHKVKFLCTRVFPTYVQLINFRAWKKFTLYKLDLRRKADNYFHQLQSKAMLVSLRYLHHFSLEKKKLKHIWMKGGITKLRRTLMLRKATPFQIWYAYAYYRRMVRNRSKTLAAPFRRLLFPAQPANAAPNRTERRKKLAEIRQERIKSIIMENRKIQRERKRIKEEKKRKAEEGSVSSGGSKRSKDSTVEQIDTAIDQESKEYSNASKIVDMDGQERLERLVQLRNGVRFKWKTIPMDVDLDSDCDEMIDIPDRVAIKYLEITREREEESASGNENLGIITDRYEPLYGPENIYRIKWIDNWVVDRVRNLQTGFVFAENWALYETAIRFHRLGHRVFQNLRVHAIVNRNARLSANAYGLKMKRLIFNGFLRWMLRDAATSGFNINDQTDGERLRESVRNIRWSKMLRRRELIQKIREKYLMDPDSAPQEEEYWSDIEPEEVRKKTQRLKEIRRYQKWSQEEDEKSVSPKPRQRNPSSLPTTPKSTSRKMTRAKLMLQSARSSSNSPIQMNPSSPPDSPSIPTALTAVGDTFVSADPPISNYEDIKTGRKSFVAHAATPKTGINAAAAKKSSPSSAPSTAVAAQHGAKRSGASETRKASTIAGHSKAGGVGGDNGSVSSDGKGKGDTAHPKTPSMGAKHKRKLTSTPTQSVDAVLSAKLTQQPDKTDLNLPNMLAWDREDRTADNSLSDGLLAYSRTIKQKSLEASIESELVATALSDAILTRDNMVVEVMNTEGALTEEAIDAEIAYSRTFKIDAARIMLDVLYNIRVAVLDNLLKVEMKKYFKVLRLPMLLRRSRSMCARKKIINWLRICRRLRSLNKLAPFYNQARTKWIIFNRWLKYLEKEALLPTPGLMNEVRRRCELLPKYSALLQSRGIKMIVYHNSLRLRQASSDLTAIFARWQNYTQVKLVFKKMKRLVHKRYYLRLVQKCFYAIKLSMLPEETKKVRQSDSYLPLERLDSDINQLSKRFIAKYRRSLVYVVRRYNIYFEAYIKKYGKKSCTFKEFVVTYEQEIGRRLATEQRILVDAFEKRGTQQFVDVLAPSNPRNSVIPDIMHKVEGNKFVDPSPHARYFSVPGAKSQKPPALSMFMSAKNGGTPATNEPFHIDSDATEMPEITPGSIQGLPAGFKLNKIRLTFGDHIGIAGWQVNWCADGIRDIDGPRRGHWFGGANSIQELIVPRGDFAIGVEYYHDGSALMGLRLKLFSGGWTKWIGGKSSLSTQSVYLGVEMSDRQPFEDEHVPAGPDEITNPAYPREYIIGLAGVQTITRVTNITLVVRKVKEQYLLSYFWVKDALDKILSDTYESMKEKWQEHLALKEEQSSLSHHSDHSKLLPSIHNKSTTSRRPSLSSTVPDTARSESNKSDTGAGGGTSRANTAAANARLRDQQPILEALDENSLDDLDSHRSDSLEPSANNSESAVAKNAINSLDEEMKAYSWMSKYSFGTGSELRTASEGQFFDVMRMRALEVTVAKERGMAFARRLWTDKEIRANVELKKLTTVLMVKGLTMWFFNALSKRLIRLVETEFQGNRLIAEARSLKKRSELVSARAAGMKMQARSMENTPQSWAGKSLLSPAERALRKVYKDKIRTFYVEAKAQEEEAAALSLEALNTDKAGRNLLPRMQLSKYTVGVFLRKLAAARHKETLLQYISVETVKAALTGVAEKSAGLPSTDMETIVNCLKGKTDDSLDINALESLVEREVVRERQRKAKGSTLPLITIRTLSGKSATAALSSQHTEFQEDIPGYMTQPLRKKRVLAVDPQHYFVRDNKNKAANAMSTSLSTPVLKITQPKRGGSPTPRHNIGGLSRSTSFTRDGSLDASSLSTLSAFDDEDV